jgi:hypothetical protein
LLKRSCYILPQGDLALKWSLYQARRSFHLHELGISCPSDTRGMIVVYCDETIVQCDLGSFVWFGLIQSSAQCRNTPKHVCLLMRLTMEVESKARISSDSSGTVVRQCYRDTSQQTSESTMALYIKAHLQRQPPRSPIIRPSIEVTHLMSLQDKDSG